MKKCKECSNEKDLSEFYTHTQTKDWYLWKCKECIKSGRKTEHERAMSRVRDKKRDQDPKRKAQKKITLYKFRNENPEKWGAEQKVSNFLRYHKDLKPIKSSVSWDTWRLHMHHPDYSKPNEVIPCTPKEHRAFHNWELEEKREYILILPF